MPKGIYPRTASHIRNLANSNRGKVRTKESKVLMSLSKLGNLCGLGNKSHRGLRSSEDINIKISRSLIGRVRTYEHCRNISKSFTIERLRVLSLRTLSRVKNGTFGQGTYLAQWFTDRLGRRMYLRSSYEVKFAQWLDSKNLTWEYEPKAFLDADGIHHVLPDFYVQEWGSYVEVKPWNFREDAYEMKRLLECVYGESCLIMTEEELKRLGSLSA